ncbi:PIG-L deacetylase family protein [Frondihabitans australicus]|uniref:LmbE family N-acetylglucosaminyl deacetylase n=1 Tax=Frondihabitans australicus TaxID=386892 RepID=A0A495IFQ5_9MICO|nr:PIG-L family deacetylase [Frondihabitans australicus]RKR74843.1 LmbE family N-acetylglucosaminyl deacetylase [Frondihabitans australicus]
MIFDSDDPGTAASEWADDPRWSRLPRLGLSGFDRLVVVAAHPDDETLGAGGLLAAAVARGLEVSVAIVTDGAAADPTAGPDRRDALARERADEARAALALLGVDDVRLLGFADGGVREERAAVSDALDTLLASDVAPARAVVVAPWRGDGHRDHRVVGEIVDDLAARRAWTVWAYPIWLWHWGAPERPEVPWTSLGTFGLSGSAQAAKAAALGRYDSQTSGERPILHERFLEHFRRNHELFVVERA